MNQPGSPALTAQTVTLHLDAPTAKAGAPTGWIIQLGREVRA